MATTAPRVSYLDKLVNPQDVQYLLQRVFPQFKVSVCLDIQCYNLLIRFATKYTEFTLPVPIECTDIYTYILSTYPEYFI